MVVPPGADRLWQGEAVNHRRPLTVIVMCCSLTVASCASDDDGAGDANDFCQLINSDDVGDDPESVANAFDQLEQLTPDELKDDVATVSAASLATRSLPDEASGEEVEAAIALITAAEESFERIDAWIEENCPGGLGS